MEELPLLPFYRDGAILVAAPEIRIT